MALLTKEELMKPVAMNMSTFEIWGGEILVWEMNGRERQIWQKKAFVVDGTGKVHFDNDLSRRFLFLMCLKDQNGQKIFTDLKEVDTFFRSKSGKDIDDIFTEIRRLNGLESNTAEEDAKNSPETRSDDFSSD
jgi:hypothetical protein